MKLREFSLILILFGIGIIFHSLLNCYETLYPFLIKNAQWVFVVSQKMPGVLILMFLGIITTLFGITLLKHKRKETILKYSKFSFGAICLITSFLLSIDIILYGISMNSVKNSSIQTIKTETTTIKEDLKYSVDLDPEEIKQVNNEIKELDKNLYSQINYLNMAYTKINIKTLGNLLLFSIVYLLIGFKLLSIDKFILARYSNKYGRT